jgi:hypothetical protein
VRGRAASSFSPLSRESGLRVVLHDPAGLLEGTGKRGRHAKLRPGAASTPRRSRS